MSTTVWLHIVHAYNTPIDRDAFSKAGDDIAKLLNGVVSEGGPMVSLQWNIGRDSMWFGPSDFDRGPQEPFEIERDPTEYLHEGKSHPIWIEACSPLFRSVVEVVVEQINHHAGPVLVLSREDRLMSPRQASSLEELE